MLTLLRSIYSADQGEYSFAIQRYLVEFNRHETWSTPVEGGYGSLRTVKNGVLDVDPIIEELSALSHRSQVGIRRVKN